VPTIEKVSRVKAHIRYRLADGTIVPGATTVLGILAKPALVKWANNLGLQGIDSTKYVDKLATIGTLAHLMVENYLTGTEPDYTSYSPEEIGKAENSLLKFLDWEKQYDIKMIFNEKPLISELYGFGGTIDCYAEINGKKALLDFKTSKAIYDEHIIQLAAYKQLLIENGFEVDEVRVLRIGRTEEEGFEERRETNLTKHWELFKHLIEVYKLKNKINRKEAV